MKIACMPNDDIFLVHGQKKSHQQMLMAPFSLLISSYERTRFLPFVFNAI